MLTYITLFSEEVEAHHITHPPGRSRVSLLRFAYRVFGINALSASRSRYVTGILSACIVSRRTKREVCRPVGWGRTGRKEWESSLCNSAAFTCYKALLRTAGVHLLQTLIFYIHDDLRLY